jgi:hypothetical protein
LLVAATFWLAGPVTGADTGLAPKWAARERPLRGRGGVGISGGMSAAGGRDARVER